MRFKKTDIFKYFISYFIIFIIPIIVLSISILNNFSYDLEREIRQKSTDDLVKIKISLDTTFDEIQNIIINLSKNPYLSFDSIVIKKLDDDIVKNVLNTTISSNNFISEIMLYINNKDYIYTSVGKIPLQSIYNRELMIKDTEYEGLNDIFGQIKGITYLSSTGLKYYDFVNNNGILIGYPLKNNENIYGFLMVLISYEKLKSYIYSLGQSENNGYLILNKDNQLIYTTNYNILWEIDEYNYNNRKFEISYDNITYKDKETGFYISSRTSSNTELKYVSILPANPIYRRYKQTVYNYYFYLSIIIFVGIGLIYLFSVTNYKPIRELINFIYSSEIPIPKNLSGIQAVMFALKYYKDNMKHLNNQIEKSSHAVKQFAILNILSGKLKALPSDMWIKELDINIKHKRISVIAVFLNIDSYLKDNKLNFVEFVEDNLRKLEKEMFVYGIEPLTTENYIFICNHNLSDNELTGLLEELLNVIEEHFDSKCTIGQGRAYQELNMVAKSYLEAVNAVEYRFIIGENSVISYAKLINELDSSFVYPNNEIQSFIFSIISCEFDKAEEILSNIINILKKSYIPLYHAKTIVIDIFGGITRTFEELDINIPGELENQDFHMLLKYKSLDEIESKIKSYIEIIKSEYVMNERNDIIVKKAVNYIEKNFCDPNFSIKAVADELKLSQANFSYIFKSCTGENVSTYVNRLRIQKAKELLEGTDMLVKDIVPQVGYYSLSSFIKKFKDHVGVTPINYRKMSRKSK